jgi:hypothetical protein
MPTRRPSPRRRHEQGQVVPLVAIFSLVLMGTMALATDLSVTTAYKRSLQNVTDAAVLAGAKWLPALASASASPAVSDETKAAQAALQVVHNSYPWPTGGGQWWTPLLTAGTNNGQVSVTVCSGMTPPGGSGSCTGGVGAAGSAGPFVLTVNVPPLTAKIPVDGKPGYVEAVMSQQAGSFFAGFVGQGNQAGAQSVGFHFAPNQPFPFALFSRTIIQSGNQGETIAGNMYADRYLAPQSNGHAGICAAPDINGNLGFIFLGYPQQDDGSPPYQNDGQSTSRGDPIVDGATCPSSGGQVGMSANPLNAAGCTGGYTGNNSASVLTFDAADGACEANPPIQPPVVAALPNLPTYPGTVCGAAGRVGGVYQPDEYQCSNGPALVVDHPLAKGIYEIDAGAGTGGCDVTMDGTITSLLGVTFYLKGGAGICITLPSGLTISQTPYDGNSGAAGDGRYAVLSDNVANPTISLSSGGGGSTSGIWSVTGTIWLPTGTVNISNKSALEDSGQIIINTWNDQSGNHQNPGVSYNGTLAPAQNELLQLTE